MGVLEKEVEDSRVHLRKRLQLEDRVKQLEVGP